LATQQQPEDARRKTFAAIAIGGAAAFEIGSSLA
jgi:hypothetical protein